jgi:hypothetical protein
VGGCVFCGEGGSLGLRVATRARRAGLACGSASVHRAER